MMGVQIWRSMTPGMGYAAPLKRGDPWAIGHSWQYYRRIDSLTAQGVKFL
jgi:hypothetical protein